MNKKNNLIKEVGSKVKNLEHDVNLSNEIVERQKIELEDKESTKTLLKSETKRAEKELETSKAQSKKDMKSLEETVGNLTKINNNLKIEMAKYKTYIKELEEANDPAEEDVGESEADEEVEEEINVEEAEVHRPESVPKVDMSKGGTDQRCEACDKIFKAAADLEKHIKDKHVDAECPMCNKLFSSRKQAEDHICMVGEIVPQICNKSYCKKEFVSSEALNKHIKNSHFGHQRNVCTKCGEM